MAENRLIVFGASGHGRVAADTALAAGWEVVGFGDDDPGLTGSLVLGLPVLPTGLDACIRHCLERGAAIFPAIGGNAARRTVHQRLSATGLEIATLIHPRAVVSPYAEVGPGSLVLPGAVINAGTRLGCNVIVNTGAIIEHDNRIGDHAHVSPGVCLGGTVRVGEGTHIGIGAAVRNNVSIGAWSVVGAGGVVVGDLPDRVVAFGCPARVVREIVS